MTVHHHSLLRTRGAKDSSKVGWVELFFDLVFVFSVTQLSHLLLADLTWNGAAEATFLMLAVWAACLTTIHFHYRPDGRRVETLPSL